MKVLWFSPTPVNYSEETWAHNGGGWISSLQNIVKSIENIDLGIVFETPQKLEKKFVNEVCYYPIIKDFTLKEKLNKSHQNSILINKAIRIIKDFKPDVIHLFGSESWYGLLVDHTHIPIVIHMQGSLPSYYNARYPVGMSVWNKIFSTKTNIKQKLMAFRIDATFHKNALQEERILKANQYFMGRTHWDKAIVNFYNPEATYYVCQEALRDSFIESKQKWSFINDSKIKIISVISGPLYKGVDVILKTAQLLKTHSSIDFEWNICGISNSDLIESVYKIKAKDVNVNYLGVLDQDVLKNKLLNSSFYIHPSYIDNSPNSVCEAQILGIPVIATDTGGLRTIIKDKETGFLVPANDPLMVAHLIAKMWDNREVLEKISSSAVAQATERHDKEIIKEQLFSVYSQIIKFNMSNI